MRAASAETMHSTMQSTEQREAGQARLKNIHCTCCFIRLSVGCRFWVRYPPRSTGWLDGCLPAEPFFHNFFSVRLCAGLVLLRSHTHYTSQPFLCSQHA